MKLSEAMREGAKLHSQSFCNYYSMGLGGEVEKTCALGACAFGAGWNQRAGLDIGSFLEFNFPELKGIMHDAYANPLSSEIANRNDKRESRESIADDLESRGL